VVIGIHRGSISSVTTTKRNRDVTQSQEDCTVSTSGSVDLLRTKGVLVEHMKDRWDEPKRFIVRVVTKDGPLKTFSFTPMDGYLSD